MTTPARRRFAQLAALAAAFCFCVIVFGAFVRLSNAGLACPDWPTCYGQITWPTAAHEIDAANAAYPERPVESHKAWREQVHRFLAGVLILATFGLAAWAIRRRGEPGWPLRAPIAVALLIVFQALLGMWTVTWKLKPIVVMGHLLGGIATLALLVWISARAFGAARTAASPKPALMVVAIVLVAIQIALGGWVSANYAAFSCGTDFPTCLGEWWPHADFSEGFVLWRGIGVDYEGGVLDGPARTAIQLAHRVFAIVVAGHLVALGARLLRTDGFRVAGATVLALLVAQIALGIANVKVGLPLHVATAHNGVAALLLAYLVYLLARTTPART
jgi:heme a synthase